MKVSSCMPYLFFFFVLTAVAQESKMPDGDAVAFRRSVNAASKDIKSLITDFTQLKHMDFLSKDVETSGRMSFKDPGLLLWQYKKPYQYSIAFKNGKILVNDAGKKSAMDVGSSKIFARINKLIIGSVSGNMFDEAEFSITYFTARDGNIVKFVPKDATLKKYIRQIELTFSKADYMVAQVRLLESSSDYTTIIFKNKSVNAKIDDSVFTN